MLSRALGGLLRVGRYAGAARQLNGLWGGHLRRLGAGHRLRAAPARRGAAAAAATTPPPPPPIPSAGFTVDSGASQRTGPTLAGRMLLYWSRWPDDEWQRGTVERLCPARTPLFLQCRGVYAADVGATARDGGLTARRGVVRPGHRDPGRWVLLSTAPAAVVVRALWSRGIWNHGTL